LSAANVFFNTLEGSGGALRPDLMPLGISLFSAYFHEHGISKYIQQKNENLINYRENELQVFM